MLNLGLGQRVEIGENIGPRTVFRVIAGGGRLAHIGNAILQLLFQDEGEEAARHVAANGFVELVKDRPRGEQTLRCAERPLHHPQALVAKHGFERREIGVGPQDEDTVEFCVLFCLGAVDGEMVVASRRKEAAIPEVAKGLQVALWT